MTTVLLLSALALLTVLLGGWALYVRLVTRG